MASRTRRDGVIVPEWHAAFSFDEVCGCFEFGSGRVADPRAGRPSGHVVPHPVPVVRNTAKSLPLLHRHPTPLTSDESFPA